MVRFSATCRCHDNPRDNLHARHQWIHRHLSDCGSVAAAAGVMLLLQVLTPADEIHHINKHNFKVPFVCGCRDLGEALRRVAEGAAMIRTKVGYGVFADWLPAASCCCCWCCCEPGTSTISNLSVLSVPRGAQNSHATSSASCVVVWLLIVLLLLLAG